MLSRKAFPDLSPESLSVVPVERSETIPSSWYTDPRFHTLDLESIFSRTWQGVGHVCQLSEPGMYFLAEVAGNPIIVVRGKDEVLRAFYNVCRHRGGPLATEDGCANALKCKYHGWTYLLDGSLRGVPQFDRVELFAKKDYGLVPVRLEVWEGLIFVNLAENPEPVARVMAGIRDRIAPIDLSRVRFAQRVDYEVKCNWKIYVDNFLEGYHVPHVHPELFKLLDFQTYRTEVFDTYSLQYSALRETENVYSSNGGEAFYYCVFPNYMLNIVPGRLQTNLVLPLAPDRCRVIFQYYYDEVDTPEARQRTAADVAYSDHVQHEDIAICERVQHGLASRAYDKGRFSAEFEEGVYHFQVLVKEAYSGWIEGVD
jgi:choline monooxygenase